MTTMVRVPNHIKRQKELEEVKSIYGVTGFAFYYRPTIMNSPGEWCCSKISNNNDNSIELFTTHPDSLKSLLDKLLNLEENDNPPQVRFGSRTYNSLEDLWKAMGKT